MSACRGLLLAVLLAVPLARAQTAADSGWRPLFNGTNLNGLYVYAVGTGVVNIPADSAAVRIGSQTTSNAMFRVDSGRIRVGGSPNGYIGTVRQYSHYRVRVQYMWPTNASASANAGLLINLDSAQVRTPGFNNGNNRPRSIEVNMKRNSNHPWSLWSASMLGPYISTKVTSIPASNAQGQYNPSGVDWTNDPWVSGDFVRVITGDLQPNPELPLGQWNTGEAHMRGADSGSFILNGQVRTRGWNFQNRVNPSNATPRIAYDRGNIGLQSEGAVLYYRNFEIMELDSVTGLPLHATTAIRASMAARAASEGRAVIAYTGLPVRVAVPAGTAGFDLHDAGGRRVWSYRGRETSVALPPGLRPGVLLVRPAR